MRTSAQFEQANQHWQRGELDAAQTILQQLVTHEPQNAEAARALGLLLLEKGRHRSAVAQIEAAFALGLDPRLIPATMRQLALTLFASGAWAQAQSWLERALATNPQDAELLRARDRVALRSYLQPEVFDPVAQESLLRYSPRESETYVYAIDVVGNCNLSCPSCPVGNTASDGRPAGLMSVELFERVLAKIEAECPAEAPEIWLFSWGEPLLHPELATLVQRVRKAGMPVHLSTNLNVEKGIKALIKAQPDVLKISLSGFQPESYERTHRDGDVFLLKSNMYLLRHYLDMYRARTRVWVGQHVYRHNQHDVEAVRAICAELGFEHHPSQAFFQPVEKLVKIGEGEVLASDSEVLDLLLTHPRDYLANLREHRSGIYDCELRFNQTAINADGSVALCCSVYEPDNQLGVSFLDHDFAALQAMKYEHPFCGRCRAQACDYSLTEVFDQPGRAPLRKAT